MPEFANCPEKEKKKPYGCVLPLTVLQLGKGHPRKSSRFGKIITKNSDRPEKCPRAESNRLPQHSLIHTSTIGMGRSTMIYEDLSLYTLEVVTKPLGPGHGAKKEGKERAKKNELKT
jgi:hypothetical protein